MEFSSSNASLDDLTASDSTNTNTSVIGVGTDSYLYVSDTAVFYLRLFFMTLASGCISIIGIVANVVNIIVFVRQGILTDSGSASLFGLAVSDLCCVASMLWFSLNFAVLLSDPSGLPWDPWNITYLVAGWPHLMFAQITRMVTAYVTFERCVCVVFPFKVKTLFTPRRSILIIASIFICFGLTYSPVYVAHQLIFKLDPSTNTSRLVMISSPHWELLTDIVRFINSMSLNVCSVAIVLITTMITVSRVKLSKTWRESLATASSSTPHDNDKSVELSSLNDKGHGNDVSNKESKMPVKQMSKSKMQKEKKIVRMITIISVIFLICYIPDMTYLLMFSIVPELRVGSKYENMSMVLFSFTFLFETINSSINIIVYYKMSSKYKKEFNRLFGREGT